MLCVKVSKAGGEAIKMLSSNVTGLPDRICLFPQGRTVFVEVKSTGKKPTPMQLRQHTKLRKLGFEVLVIDSIEGVESLIGKI